MYYFVNYNSLLIYLLGCYEHAPDTCLAAVLNGHDVEHFVIEYNEYGVVVIIQL